MRESLRILAAASLVAGPTALAFFSGGFFDRPRLIAGIAAWALVVVAALTAARPLPVSIPGRVALAGLVLLTIWTALSLAWAPLGDRAQDDLQRLLLYLGFFVASLALLRAPAVRRWLEPSVVLGALVVVGYGLSERVLPGLIELERSRSASGRLEQPITYWNAFGAVAAIGLVIAIRVAGDPRRGGALRAVAAAAGAPLALGAYLSLSRGALAAIAAGVLMLLALAPAGRLQLRSVVAIIGTGVVVALVASRLPTVETLDRGVQGDAGQGLQMLGVLVLAALLAAAIVIRTPRREPQRLASPVSPRTAVLVGGVVALLGAVTAAAVLEGKPEGISPDKRARAARLGSIDTNRYRYWDVALDVWTDRPLTGVGSGGFLVDWRRLRDRTDLSGDAHSLYLETAAELGLVGLGLLMLLIGGVGAGTVRLYRRRPAAAAGLAAGLGAWAVHAGLDWDWEVPALTLMAFLLAAAAIAWSEEPVAPGDLAESARQPTAHQDEVAARVAGDGSGHMARKLRSIW
jgi:hypothetical protein